MIVDTHVLYWWVEFPEKLSGFAAEAFAKAERDGDGLVACGVSFWELEIKRKRGLLETRRPLSEWISVLNELTWLDIVPTEPRIWLASEQLGWEHRDPADRIIAATALSLGRAALTKDRRFHEDACPVEAVWQ